MWPQCAERMAGIAFIWQPEEGKELVRGVKSVLGH